MADEYTPKDHEVRSRAVWGANWVVGLSEENAEAQFDRWLAEYRRQVIEECAQVAFGLIVQREDGDWRLPESDLANNDTAKRIGSRIRALAEKGADRA